MPVGTQATVKSLDPAELRALGAPDGPGQHLPPLPAPRRETSSPALGGLHRFMGWDGPILTDSGGFQVFSLAHLRRLDEDGVTFRSHIDGSERRLTPEVAVAASGAARRGRDHGLRRVPRGPGHATSAAARRLDRTQRWAERCRRAHTRPDQALFGIVQGGVYDDLRLQGARAIGALDFPGYAIGGVSVGESKADCWRVACPGGRPCSPPGARAT